jgi:hypothetical protein
MLRSKVINSAEYLTVMPFFHHTQRHVSKQLILSDQPFRTKTREPQR